MLGALYSIGPRVQFVCQREELRPRFIENQGSRITTSARRTRPQFGGGLSPAVRLVHFAATHDQQPSWIIRRHVKLRGALGRGSPSVTRTTLPVWRPKMFSSW
jgi:hypothetical protein